MSVYGKVDIRFKESNWSTVCYLQTCSLVSDKMILLSNTNLVESFTWAWCGLSSLFNRADTFSTKYLGINFLQRHLTLLTWVNFAIAGKYINGTILPVDGGLWLSRPRHLPKDAVKQLSRVVEKKSRNTPVGVPKSKL